MEQRFEKLLKILKSFHPNANLGLVKKAWEFAKLVHYNQKRKNGEPYISHLLETALLLAEWELDEDVVIAGLLHDSMEDGAAKPADLISEFGEKIYLLVDGVTKVSSVRLRGSRDLDFVENLRKMFVVMAKDIRVVLIKIADRLHNLRTLYALPPDKQKKIAIETLEIYAPLAERLQMGQVTTELNDISFSYAYPDEYRRVARESKVYYKEAEDHIKGMKKRLIVSLAKEGIRARIDGRKKSYYSLWLKLKRKEIDWDYKKVYDIVALRIVVDTIADCYASLGIVHSVYKPVPYLGISDFIAQPKPNGYRSIHTRVFGPKGRIVEIQIRTKKMHEEAEMGIAAHWAYNEAKISGEEKKLEGARAEYTKLSWVRELLNWMNEIKDSREFLEALRFDTLQRRNYVFTPKGDVLELPEGATPVDFAFAVHTKLPYYLRYAKVNGRVVPLDHKLSSGDVVEIVKSREKKGIGRDWISFVVTNLAKREIRKHFRAVKSKEEKR